VTTQLTLRDDMRKLWTEHALWTRVFLIDSIAGLPGADAAYERLLRNQVDIGDAIRPFYGDDAGDQLTLLLRAHVAGTAAMVAAVKTGDRRTLGFVNTAWYANAHQIAVFLADTSRELTLAELDPMMRAHVYQTEAQAMARIQGDWTMDVETYDTVVSQTLEVADAMSGAIALQFGEMVAVDAAVTSSRAELHRAMRRLWQDHVSWNRVFIVDLIAGLPDTGTARTRLLQNRVDLGNAIEPFYGEDAANTLASLLHDHVDLTERVVRDAKNGNAADFAIASNLWYANADRIATFLAIFTQSLPLADLKALVRMHLDLTLAEVDARLSADWLTDVASYDAHEARMLALSDAVADGIVTQFPAQFAR